MQGAVLNNSLYPVIASLCIVVTLRVCTLGASLLIFVL